MKNKFIKILALVTVVFAFAMQSLPVINAAEEPTTVSADKNKSVDTKSSTNKSKNSDNVTNSVETKTVQQKAAEDKTSGTTPHTGVMGYMYAKQELKLDITNKKKMQDSPIQAIANRANSVLDTSEWQGNFTDAQVKKLKTQHKFIILRVQYGSSYKDKTFAHNVALMDKYGMKYGVYSFSQYINPKDAAQEAKDLYNRAPKASFYVNDYEDQTVTSGGTDASTAAWLTEMRKHSGKKKVLFYSYASFMQSYAPNAMKKYDAFWLAAYQSYDPTTAAHDMWQYTNTYNSSALNQNVDASIGTSKNLDWFLSAKGNTAVATNKTVIMKKGWTIWNDLDFKKAKNQSEKILGNPYSVKYYYNHDNGNIYYSLYASNGDWIGYINADGAKVITKSTTVKNVSINNRAQTLWNNFAYQKAKHKSSEYYDGNTNLQVKVAYTTDPGWTYYSLYDSKGTWQGYMNSKFTTDLTAKSLNKKVTISSPYPLWTNFFWKHRGDTKVGQTYTAKYVYKQGNGKSYYSLYNSKGTWMGYINAVATKSDPFSDAIASNKTVLLKKGYTVWNDLNFKKVKNQSDKMLGNPYSVKYYRNHDNGNIYYSLYASNGSWVGYINKGGAKEIVKSTPNKTVKINSRSEKIYTNLNYKFRSNTASYYDKKTKLKVKVSYTTDPGWVYYSLYDNSNKWQGYINAKFTTAS